jgi:hypothetical protein
MWVDRQGAGQPLAAPSRTYNNPRISPDDGRVAFQVLDLAQTIDFHVCVYDLTRGTTSRLTFERVNGNPLWTPDSKRLIHTSGTVGNPDGTTNKNGPDCSGPVVKTRFASEPLLLLFLCSSLLLRSGFLLGCVLH